MKAETPPIPFDKCLSETETQTDVISSPAPFGGMMEEQTDSLWSTIDLNEEVVPRKMHCRRLSTNCEHMYFLQRIY